MHSVTKESAAQTMLNALILLACDEGEYQIERSINETIARVLNISMKTIERVSNLMTPCTRLSAWMNHQSS